MNTEPRSSTEIIISALHIIARDLEFTESAAVCEAAGRLEELDQQVRQLQGDNKALISQNQYLRQRPDLPVDRIPAYKKHAEQIKQLENERDEHLDHLKQICEIVGEVENGKHDIGVAWESVAAIKYQRDELAEKNEALTFCLVDSVKLAAVVAYPETHKDCDWKPMAISHMKAMQDRVACTAERDDKIRLAAINHLADIFSGALDAGFIEVDEKLAADVERMIRTHGHDNYHPDGFIKKMNREAQ